MTNEEKQVLIVRINKHIEWLKKEAFNRYNDHAAVKEEVAIYEIALSALTAQPVKFPPRRSMLTREDIDMGHETCMAISVEDAIAAIRAAGYEVQE